MAVTGTDVSTHSRRSYPRPVRSIGNHRRRAFLFFIFFIFISTENLFFYQVICAVASFLVLLLIPFQLPQSSALLIDRAPLPNCRYTSLSPTAFLLTTTHPANA